MDKAEIYIGEAVHQIRYAKMCFAAYKRAKQDDDIPLVFFHVHHFVVHAANVDKVLDPKTANSRIQVLKECIDLTGINLKALRRLRNHLEHFDERLDDWVAHYEGEPFFDMNLVDGTRGFPEKAFLRALDGDVFKFYGESYDLAELFSQLLEIEKCIPERWRDDGLQSRINPERHSK
ncbi:MAG: hypothetical protein AB1817_03770 [Chloroflexota bacterium]